VAEAPAGVEHGQLSKDVTRNADDDPDDGDDKVALHSREQP
jgi:hypothetical protein